MNKTNLIDESIYLTTQDTSGTNQGVQEQLHVKRFYTNPNGTPVLMIHGSVENGKIFYSNSGKGLAPYLAQQGYDVFVVDLRGRGLSKPYINRRTKHGLTEILRTDFPLYIEKIKELKGDVPQHWMAHSWGGVLILAFLARHMNDVKIASMVFFATKRRIGILTLKKLVRINVFYNVLLPIAVKQKGYFDAIQFKAGSERESRKSLKQTAKWVNSKQWRDWNDKFDYAAALKKIKLPPTLYLAACNDELLGHPEDIKRLMIEVGNQNQEYRMVGKANGNKQDYDHNNILTHKDAPDDVFPIAVDFMKKHS